MPCITSRADAGQAWPILGAKVMERRLNRLAAIDHVTPAAPWPNQLIKYLDIKGIYANIARSGNCR